MSTPKLTIRYLGYRSLPDGGRQFDFSLALSGAQATLITINAPIAIFRGPDHIAIQEAAGICYETLKSHIHAHAGTLPDRLDLTAADVAQHRRSQTKGRGSESRF